ncbi:hypothetical protein mRhiFer1_009257 [Rhinolophus ferrumequinum]|uniref:Uncharacterized protein n=1 Tax=Rhinolophus ferrumequinum TaxID=59479 RepID=A0A7J7S877_RHIFE|nr:hypothetical protein mRhiFer1_009257 [Rhinolophus ferrumequinum]
MHTMNETTPRVPSPSSSWDAEPRGNCQQPTDGKRQAGCASNITKGECEVFQIAGPATQVRMAAAEAGGTLMMRRKMAAGSSPCWYTPIPVGKGLASAFWGRDEGSGWQWQKLQARAQDTQSRQLPQQELSCQAPRLDG